MEDWHTLTMILFYLQIIIFKILIFALQKNNNQFLYVHIQTTVIYNNTLLEQIEIDLPDNMKFINAKQKSYIIFDSEKI